MAASAFVRCDGVLRLSVRRVASAAILASLTGPECLSRKPRACADGLRRRRLRTSPSICSIGRDRSPSSFGRNRIRPLLCAAMSWLRTIRRLRRRYVMHRCAHSDCESNAALEPHRAANLRVHPRRSRSPAMYAQVDERCRHCMRFARRCESSTRRIAKSSALEKVAKLAQLQFATFLTCVISLNWR